MCDQLFAQQVNLVMLFKSDRLHVYYNVPPTMTDGTDKPAVTASGFVVLKGVAFNNGRLEIDLQGKDAFQHSFLGPAFNGKLKIV